VGRMKGKGQIRSRVLPCQHGGRELEKRMNKSFQRERHARLLQICIQDRQSPMLRCGDNAVDGR